MKQLSIIVLLVLALTSCSVENQTIAEELIEVIEEPTLESDYWFDDEVYSTILFEGDDEQVFKSYLLAFIADAKRYNVDLSHVDVNKSTLEIIEADIIGAKTSCNPTVANIVWNREAWLNRYPLNKVDEPYRLYLFWHEFGHDILGLDHICMSGHIMTSRTSNCRGEGNEGDEINLYGLKYNTEEELKDFRRAVGDMFSMVNQFHFDCRTSFSSKQQPKTSSCNLSF